MQLFYHPDIDTGIATLDAEESRHCVKVLRLREGDAIDVADGRGTLCHCRIVSADARACVVEAIERERDFRRRPFRLHLAVAPTKNAARIEWLVEKAVEIGIDEITPVICDHSERGVQKTDRLEKIAISAMKQSLRATLPTIHPATPLATLLQQPFDGQRLVCYCDGDHRQTLADTYSAPNDALLLIGPEGDFSAQEIEQALQQGYAPITLGDTRLRTETAALYAVAALNFMNER